MLFDQGERCLTKVCCYYLYSTEGSVWPPVDPSDYIHLNLLQHLTALVTTPTLNLTAFNKVVFVTRHDLLGSYNTRHDDDDVRPSLFYVFIRSEKSTVSLLQDKRRREEVLIQLLYSS